jgi:DNA-binding CsgD family transcriptional regulator
MMQTNRETTVYTSKHLTIEFDLENSLFIAFWNHSEKISTEDFKDEMLGFKNTFIDYLPSKVIWQQEGFTTDVDPETYLWTEENVNQYCMSNGLEKVAFVVGKDVMVYLEMINTLDNYKSCLLPKHFAGKQEAINWILDIKTDEDFTLNTDDIDIRYLGKTKEGKSQFTIETHTSNTESTLKTFNQIIRENAFLKENAVRFGSLTHREKEVFNLYANGAGFKDIGETLFLSEFTVRTHWRNAKKKLSIKTLSDIADYKNSFL